jgi:alpha,alpha-trehalase
MFSRLLLLALPLSAAPAEPVWTVPVEENFTRLLKEDDADGDKKITVADAPKRPFDLVDAQGRKHPVAGEYPLSVLLQELSLARDRGLRETELSPKILNENAVDRTHRMIRGLFWDSLTRAIDEAGLPRILEDSKSASADGRKRLYTPHDDAEALAYFRGVAERHPDWKLTVERLPEKITAEFVRGLDGRHGPLSLALKRGADGKVSGVPFVVPGGRFNELYGWDSHFIALGLLEDGRVDLARSTLDDQIYEIRHYGRILNANRTYYLTRSQPPFLTSSLRETFDRLPDGPERLAWLAKGLEAAIAEYRGVWTSAPRLVEPWGLSRYYDEGKGPCPEVEPGHYDAILRPYAEKEGVTPARYLKGFLDGRYRSAALDEFFLHDRAVRESGHDTTYRFDDRTADFLTVDLNSLLYKTETDIADLIDERFGGELRVSEGRVEFAAEWRDRAAARRKKMSELFWDEKRGMFFDYDFKNKRRSTYAGATTFYPLWAGWATPEQAAAVRAHALPVLERLGGLAATAEESRGPLSAARPARQWDYPYGWAPHQILAWRGLERYGYRDDARRLAYRWLWTIVKNARDYDGTVPEKYDVVKASHEVFAEYGNVGTKFSYITKEGFGWMNASYELGLKLLSLDQLASLRELKPPAEVFPPAPARP